MIPTLKIQTALASAGIGLSALLFVSACERDNLADGPVAPRTVERSIGTTPKLLYDRPEERPFRDIATQAPSFAGFWQDSVTGEIVVAVVDTARDGVAAVSAVSNMLRRNQHSMKNGIRVSGRSRSAKFTFLELAGWRDLVTKNLFGPNSGILWDDADEVNNKVAIGIDASRASQIRSVLVAALINLGIPPDAVRVEESSHVQYTAGRESLASSAGASFFTPTYSPTQLTDPALPLSGGQLIHVNYSGAYWDATAGFIVKLNGAYYLTTVAHAARAGVVDGSTAYLSDYTSMGSESYDPGLYYSSRYSDASLYAMSNGSNAGLGRIWRPSANAGTTGSTLYIDQATPYFVIIGVQSTFWVNQGVSKVGTVTGWTYGSITATCQDHDDTDPPSGVWWVRLCQHEARYFSDYGDSGSPVFTTDGENGAYLAGIHWGRHNCGFCSPVWQYSIFSPWSGITQDMSNFYQVSGLNPVTDMSLGTPDLTGSYVSGSTAVITWPAVSAVNTSQTTTYKVYRTVWDASVGSYRENGELVSTTTGTSYSDDASYFALNSFNGTLNPGSCPNSYKAFVVKAYNSGLITTSQTVWFLGPYEGCQGG